MWTGFPGVLCFYCLHSKLDSMQSNSSCLCFKRRTGLEKSLPCSLPAWIIHDSMALWLKSIYSKFCLRIHHQLSLPHVTILHTSTSEDNLFNQFLQVHYYNFFFTSGINLHIVVVFCCWGFFVYFFVFKFNEHDLKNHIRKQVWCK